jgi:hypothetical protein
VAAQYDEWLPVQTLGNPQSSGFPEWTHAVKRSVFRESANRIGPGRLLRSDCLRVVAIFFSPGATLTYNSGDESYFTLAVRLA